MMGPKLSVEAIVRFLVLGLLYRTKRTYVRILIAILTCRITLIPFRFCASTEIKKSPFTVSIYVMIVAPKDRAVFRMLRRMYTEK